LRSALRIKINLIPPDREGGEKERERGEREREKESEREKEKERGEYFFSLTN
jgi:hypothetical protein